MTTQSDIPETLARDLRPSTMVYPKRKTLAFNLETLEGTKVTFQMDIEDALMLSERISYEVRCRHI